MKGGNVTDDYIQKILDFSFEIILVLEEDGKVEYINQAGRKELGEVGLFFPVSVILPQIDLLRESWTIEQLAGLNMDTMMYRKNKTCFPVNVRFECPKEHCIFAFVTNLSREDEMQKQIEKDKRELEKACSIKSEFVTNITHELRTPVNGIMGHVKNLYKEETNKSKRETLEIVLDCCKGMEKLIGQILDYSKMNAGKLELDEKEFSVAECVNSVINTNISVANEKGIFLTSFISDEIPENLIGDEFRLAQVLNNLVSNAVKFTTIGSVRVEVYRTGGTENETELSFLVTDTGIGMDYEECDKLFKSFSQVDASITRKFGGTGLGLYISQELVHLMKGNISVESAKGKGTTFSFSIYLKGKNTGSVNVDKEVLNISKEIATQKVGGNNTGRVNETEIIVSEKEIQNISEKLMLAIEMNSWQKAEIYAEKLKLLFGDKTSEKAKLLFKLVMSIRREDYEKSHETFQLMADLQKRNT